MKTPSYEQGIQLQRNWVELLAKLDREGAQRLISGFDRVHAIAHGESTRSGSFPAWKTIKLGTLKSADDFRNAIKGSGNYLGDWASDIMSKPAFTVSETEEEFELVNVSVSELGFNEATRRDKIYARALELGLELCPPEAGPQLRLQYKDQPKGEWLLIAMEPIMGSGGGPCVFGVERRDVGASWLGAYYGWPDFVWSPALRWLFRRRK